MPRIQVNDAVLKLFSERRVCLQHPNGQAPAWLGFRTGCAVEAYSHVFTGPWMPYRMGAFSYSHSALVTDLFIGRFCSISSEVTWLRDAHPMDWVTSYPLTYDPAPLPGVRDFFEDFQVDLAREEFDQGLKPTFIGDDAWIGTGAAIMPGVRLGTGSVVAARALVLKDVEPYAIVGAPRPG